MNVIVNQQDQKLDASRGTALWGLNWFRRDALTALLDDLLDMQRTGVDDAICGHVKESLGKVVNIYTSVPDGGFLRSVIWKELQRFSDKYADWNDVYGDDLVAINNRQKSLRELRNRRHKIAKKIRYNQHILANELDLQLIDATYDALSGLIKSVPGIFSNLAKAINRYLSRK
jgi:hypothetical protein